MKLVREHIFEKFAEESDPVRDMGIGGIDINKEWKTIDEEIDAGNLEDADEEWKQRLEELFVGKKVTGNFHQGNSDSYGGLQRITTRKPVERIEYVDSEGEGAFALVTIDPGVYKYHASDGNYIEKDEVWYYVILSQNTGRKIFVSE
jgi:hypothetical protein